MKLQLLTLLSLFFVLNCYYVYSDPSTTTVQFPLSAQTILQKSYAKADPNPIDYNSNWIWTNVTTTIATFQTLFHGRGAGVAELYIKANSTYYAYVNGVSVRAGYKYQSESTSVYLSCGINNLTIKVENTDPNATSSGLVFRITHHETYYLQNCNNNAFYNYSSCACQCLGTFTCMPAQIVVGYPTCGCKCANQGLLYCNNNNQYFDQKTCACKCYPTYCRPGFELDPATCSCRCTVSSCTTGTWNYNQCRCL